MKRCVLRRFRKTVSVGADVTSDCRLFQRPHPATGHRKRTVADSGQPCTSDRSCMDDDDRRRRRLESATSWMWHNTDKQVRQLNEAQPWAYPGYLIGSGVTEGTDRPPRVTLSRGWHPNKITFLWLNLERTLDKEGRGKMAVVRRRQVVSFFSRKKLGWHNQLTPRVTPTLVTPLLIGGVLSYFVDCQIRGRTFLLSLSHTPCQSGGDLNEVLTIRRRFYCRCSYLDCTVNHI